MFPFPNAGAPVARVVWTLILILAVVYIGLRWFGVVKARARNRMISVLILLDNGPAYAREFARILASTNFSVSYSREGFMAELRTLVNRRDIVDFSIVQGPATGDERELQTTTAGAFSEILHAADAEKVESKGSSGYEHSLSPGDARSYCLMALLATSPTLFSRAPNPSRLYETFQTLLDSTHAEHSQIYFANYPGPSGFLSLEDGRALFRKAAAAAEDNLREPVRSVSP